MTAPPPPAPSARSHRVHLQGGRDGLPRGSRAAGAPVQEPARPRGFLRGFDGAAAPREARRSCCPRRPSRTRWRMPGCARGSSTRSRSAADRSRAGGGARSSGRPARRSAPAARERDRVLRRERPGCRAPSFAIAIVTGAALTVRKAWTALRVRSLDINVLMTIIAPPAPSRWASGLKPRRSSFSLRSRRRWKCARSSARATRSAR